MSWIALPIVSIAAVSSRIPARPRRREFVLAAVAQADRRAGPGPGGCGAHDLLKQAYAELGGEYTELGSESAPLSLAELREIGLSLASSNTSRPDSLTAANKLRAALQVERTTEPKPNRPRAGVSGVDREDFSGLSEQKGKDDELASAGTGVVWPAS